MTLSKLARQRFDRDRKRAQGATGREYDPDSDRYVLQPAQLANLDTGRAIKRAAADKRRAAIAGMCERGFSVADIVMATGISRAAVYRLMPPSVKRIYTRIQQVDPLLL